MNLNNYVDLIKSRRVLEPVIASQKLDKTYEELSESVQVINEKNTNVISIIVSTTNANQSTRLANDIASSARSSLTTIYNKDDVVVIDPAVNATKPHNVRQAMQIAIATALGLSLGLATVYFMYDLKESFSHGKKTNDKYVSAVGQRKNKSSSSKKKKTEQIPASSTRIAQAKKS
jgi:capsular polysaccharide biosynthesis protein